MKKSDINILIVEDDKSLRAALEQGITRAGFRAIAVDKADAAFNAIKIKPVQAAVIDCMLPVMNGVDLAKQLRKGALATGPIYFTSGIYRDKAFASDAVRKTSATDFLYKPFDIEELISLLEESLAGIIDSPKVALHSLLSKPFASNRERRRALDHVDQTTGLDLPLIFSILMEAESSGYLNIVSSDGDIFGVTFASGRITQVDTDKTTETQSDLLLQKGFLTREELNEIHNKKLKGHFIDNLVTENLVSPHAGPIIKREQMLVELKRLINNSSIQINFAPDRKLKADPEGIEIEEFTLFIHQILNSSFDLNWFLNFYKDWLDHPIQIGPQFSESHPIMSMPILTELPNFIGDLKSEPTVVELLDKPGRDEEKVYKALHLLTMRRLVVFDEDKRERNFDVYISWLKDIHAKIQNKNPSEVFQFFGLPAKPKVPDVVKVYRDFAKSNHPDKLPAAASEEVRQLAHKVFSIVTNAHDVLSNETKREEFFRSLEQKQAEAQVKAESQLDDAIQLIRKNRANQAVTLLNEVMKINPSVETQLYWCWATLKVVPKNITRDSLQKIEKILNETPHEKRRIAIYQHVVGLLRGEQGQHKEAYQAFAKAIELDNRFLEARREISALKAAGKSGAKMTASDFLKADLGELAKNLFKKKSK